ncbi:hypothetical protein NQ317_000630 [Molorchus minor]|uniref:Uncharacterized protein n=1 Tax=Molorchus minor TaxID=1323400 RepID=A0ABQ9JJM4_9CUCU|nr:hypothetical protein NQ317_000630 [Molorchus minor]
MSRKQPLYFVNPRKEVISVFKGVMNDDFKYFNTKEELETELENYTVDGTELQNLLDSGQEYLTSEISNINGKNMELNVVIHGENQRTLSHRNTC